MIDEERHDSKLVLIGMHRAFKEELARLKEYITTLEDDVTAANARILHGEDVLEAARRARYWIANRNGDCPMEEAEVLTLLEEVIMAFFIDAHRNKEGDRAE